MALVYKKPKNKGVNPFKSDPSQTGAIRRGFMKMMQGKMNEFDRRIDDLIVRQNIFGIGVTSSNPVLNVNWQFFSTADQLEAFKTWVIAQMEELLYPQEEESWWLDYIRRGWQQGANKVFNAWKSPSDFLRSSFNQPVSIQKVKVLASRVLTELQNVTQDMATKMSRSLVDGLIGGKSPREVAKDMHGVVDGISKQRALTIARTETVRAHAEGQLDTLEGLGMDQVGVAVEWSTSGMGQTRKGNPSPCKLCEPMKGVVFSIQEARGMIPRHPNCMCSFIPAGVGEDGRGQKKGYRQITSALQKSLQAEIPKASKRTVAQQAKRTGWVGSRNKISKNRPKSLVG